MLHVAGGGFTSKRGTFGNVAKLDSMMCVAFGKSADVAYTGGGNGSIYEWGGTSLRKAIKAHEGPCFAMHSLDKVQQKQVKCKDQIAQYSSEVVIVFR